MYVRTSVNPSIRARSVHPHFRDVSPMRDSRITDEERRAQQERMDQAMAITKARLGNIRVCFPAHV